MNIPCRLDPIFYKTCETCSGDDTTKPYLVDERSWNEHLGSKAHKRSVRGDQPPIDWTNVREEARLKALEKEERRKLALDADS
jgi:hypothetical protein